MKILLVVLSLSCIANLFALNPSRTYKQRPEKYNMHYKQHKVHTKDGAILNAWYFKAHFSTTNLILISHNGEGNMANYLRRVDQFVQMGYNVMIYDYRGFGESSEFEIDNRMYIYPQFQQDFIAMVDFCRKNFIANFDLYGWGMGAGLSLGIGYHRTEIKKIIADTPFLSIKGVRLRSGKWEEPLKIPETGYIKKYEPYFTLNDSPGKNLRNILLIVGSNDALFSKADMEVLQKKQNKLFAKEIFVVENPDRKDNFRVDKASYFKMIRSFLGA